MFILNPFLISQLPLTPFPVSRGKMSFHCGLLPTFERRRAGVAELRKLLLLFTYEAHSIFKALCYFFVPDFCNLISVCCV